MSSLTLLLYLTTLTIIHAMTIGLTGDVNLNPSLPKQAQTNYTYVWGDMIQIIREIDLFAINHESTIAEIEDHSPHIIQFEDPLNYQLTYGPEGAQVDFMSVANNHQFDYGVTGFENSIEQMEKFKIPYGGIGFSVEDVKKPHVVKGEKGDVAFFTLVIDECWRNPDGSLFLDGCTCGDNAGGEPPYQCYMVNKTFGGMWYHWGIDKHIIQEVSSVVGDFKEKNPEMLVIVFFHVGPNFQWHPYEEREQLFRNVSDAGADIIWGTSSHHMQRMEYYKGTPIIYGMGDFMFRHVVGVEDHCPEYAIPCSAYRPDLSIMYVFDVHFEAGKSPIVSNNVIAHGTIHDDYQTFRVSESSDIRWIEDTFNAISNDHGASMKYSHSEGYYNIKLGN